MINSIKNLLNTAFLFAFTACTHTSANIPSQDLDAPNIRMVIFYPQYQDLPSGRVVVNTSHTDNIVVPKRGFYILSVIANDNAALRQLEIQLNDSTFDQQNMQGDQNFRSDQRWFREWRQDDAYTGHTFVSNISSPNIGETFRVTVSANDFGGTVGDAMPNTRSFIQLVQVGPR